MICPACGVETLGLNHNNRGLRCTNCWELLPVEPGAVAVEAPEAEAKEEKPEAVEAETKDAPKPAPKKKVAKD